MRATSVILLAALLSAACSAPRPAGSGSSLSEGEVRLLQAHYDGAERELRARDVSRLSPEQREIRERLLDEFRAYRERGEFGVNLDFPEARVPYFVDAGGRPCAVANLMLATGERALVEEIAATRNHAWVAELASDPELGGWLERCGFTVEEAARIQGPGGGGGPPMPPPPPPPPAGPVAEGPRAAARPASPASIDGPRVAPNRPSTPVGAPATPGGSAPRGGPLTPGEGEDWWTWWEANRGEFLRPNPFREGDSPRTGDEIEGPLPESVLEEHRRGLIPLLVGCLDDAEPGVRSSAAVALGKIAGREAVPYLRQALGDCNRTVRDAAILGLGASGAGEAVPTLAGIAQGEGGERDSRGSRDAGRFLAFLALGAGRRSGLDPRTDGVVAAFLRSLEGADEPAEEGALLYHTLAPSRDLLPFAVSLATDRRRPPSLRCRAIESLRSADDPETLATLLRLLNGPNPDLRRSAALALGSFRHSLALQPLQTAFELEREPLTRAFLLLAIGRQGGPVAKEFLVHTLRTGPSPLRHWCALALGIAAREDGDREARLAIRAAARSEKNRDVLPAYFVASGIARDPEAADALRDALSTASDPRIRATAAISLAMTGNPGAREALLARLEKDPCPWTRAAIGQALGLVSDLRDVGTILRLAGELRDATHRATAAYALGFHGTMAAVEGLAGIVRSKETAPQVRSAAVAALGISLGRPAGRTPVTEGTNYTVLSSRARDLARFAL
ncbi:MAG: HEAT repeat domain-containing protein [Planctomycetes bacterium]|nr:HEAT repeat domain-containing protein [Planctomycetota bacterium]